MKMVDCWIDYREKEIIHLLNASGIVDFEEKNLQVGDIQIKDIIIERKTIPDFINSIMDKRLWVQAKELKRIKRHLLAVVGDYRWDLGTMTKYRKMTYKQLAKIYDSAIRSLEKRWFLNVKFFQDDRELTNFIIDIVHLNKLDGSGEFNPYNKVFVKDPALQIVCSLPNVGIKRGKILLKYFKTPLNIFNASIDELKQIEGVGEKLAKKIHQSLRNRQGKK